MLTMTLDIGGTAVKSGICQDGTLTDIRETPTDAAAGGAHVVNRAMEIIADYRRRYEFSQIGISTAGQVNPIEGSITYANQNIPGYTGTKLKALIEEAFLVPVSVENDVNAAAIGEAAFGAGKGLSDFVCLTYGTGVGGAIFTGGRLYSGSSYCAGEFGAIVTHPEDRRPGEDMFLGCYEKYASTTALVKNAMRIDPSFKNGRIIFERQDEKSVRAVLDQWILEIVYGLTTIIHMLNPSAVILGGGVMEQPQLLEKIEQTLYPNIMPSFRNVSLKRATLGNRAGMLGASILHLVSKPNTPPQTAKHST